MVKYCVLTSSGEVVGVAIMVVRMVPSSWSSWEDGCGRISPSSSVIWGGEGNGGGREREREKREGVREEGERERGEGEREEGTREK